MCVLQEIISYIKGSDLAFFKSLACGRNVVELSEEEYIQLGRKVAPTFSSTQRRSVYHIFKKYQSKRLQIMQSSVGARQIGLVVFDTCDATYQVFRRLKSYCGTKLEEIYRDEIQVIYCKAFRPFLNVYQAVCLWPFSCLALYLAL